MANTTTLKLPDALKRRVALLARAEGKTQHAWMVEAVQAQAEFADIRREFINDAHAAAREIDAGGPVFALEDVVARLRARRPLSPG